MYIFQNSRRSELLHAIDRIDFVEIARETVREAASLAKRLR